MSSILKALKKLEEEQAGRSTSVNRPRSGGQFVAPQGSRRWRPWLLISCGVGGGLLLAGAAYLFSARLDTVPTPSPAAPALVATGTAAPVANNAPAAPPTASPSINAAQAAKRVVPVAPELKVAVSPATPKPVTPSATNQQLGVTARIADAPAPAQPVVIPASPPPVSSAPQQPFAAMPAAPSAHEPVERVQVERHEIPAPGQQWSAPYLTVSEILPSSSGGRMAIVNGLPVMEGTMVDDAVVREIRADQVVFEIEGKSIVVPLEKRP